MWSVKEEVSPKHESVFIPFNFVNFEHGSAIKTLI